MRRSLRRAFIFSTCVVAFAATAATAASAADSTGDDAQLEDVSKQVSSIEKKLDELLAHGQWARAGKLLAGAECGYGDPSSMFAAWGDDAGYVLAPQGDLAASDGWTLNKQATVVPSADPFSGAQNSLQFVKGADAGTPAMCVAPTTPRSASLSGTAAATKIAAEGRRSLRGLRRPRETSHDRQAAGRKRVGAVCDSPDVHERPRTRFAEQRDGSRISVQGGRASEGRDAVDLESLR